MTKRAKTQKAARFQPIPIDGPSHLHGGPGLYVMEEYAEGSSGKAKRYKALPAEHPLVKARYNGKVSEDQFQAGNQYRVLYEKANDPSGVDSTQFMAISRTQNGNGVLLAKGEKLQAIKCLKIINRRMGIHDREIIRRFCGLGLPMGVSVQAVVLQHPNGYLYRLKEALDDLQRVLRSVSLPDLEREIPRKYA